MTVSYVWRIRGKQRNVNTIIYAPNPRRPQISWKLIFLQHSFMQTHTHTAPKLGELFDCYVTESSSLFLIICVVCWKNSREKVETVFLYSVTAWDVLLFCLQPMVESLLHNAHENIIVLLFSKAVGR